MKAFGIITVIGAAIALINLFINELGEYCEELNPYASDDENEVEDEYIS